MCEAFYILSHESIHINLTDFVLLYALVRQCYLTELLVNVFGGKV
jgi:hypothetical protein